MSFDIETSKQLPDLDLEKDTMDKSDVFSNSETPVWSQRLNKSGHDLPSSISQYSYKQSNSKSQHEEPNSGRSECRITPRRTHNSSKGGLSKQKQADNYSGSKPCEQHTFLTDVTEVRQMEQGLLKLLDDFHLGKLQAFGKDCTFERMEQVREQQERLARVHFELNAQQEIPQSEDARRVGRENLRKLITNLQHLSRSIEQLQILNPVLQSDV